MGKYLYLDDNEMKHLMKKASDLGMVFRSPNDVLRDYLGFGERPKGHSHRERKAISESQKKKSSRTKIRVDDDVWSAWKHIRAEARKGNTDPCFLDNLVEQLYGPPPKGEEKAIRRPATRRR